MPTILVLFASSIFGLAPCAGAAEQRVIRILEAADRVLDASREPPGEAAAWQRVALPDELRRTPQGTRGRAWYRIRFSLEQVPERPQALLLRHLRAVSVEFRANGASLGNHADWASRRAGAFGVPVRVTLPPSLLRAGENELLFRLSGSTVPTLMHGLGRVSFGDAALLREAELLEGELAAQSYRYCMAAMLTAGMIALLLWYVRREDRVMFWFAVACLLWAFSVLVRLTLRETGDPLLLSMNFNLTRYGLVPPTVVICLRIAGERWRNFEFALWALLAGVVAAPVFGINDLNPWHFFAPPLVAAALLLVGAAAIVTRVPKPLRWSHRLEVAAVVAMALLLCHELARYFGWIDVDAAVLRHFHVPVMVIAIGAAILERHVLAFWRIEQSNAELERRVMEKSREIEANSATLEEARRQQALAAERQRILADMHDGVGASLIGLVRHVQSGSGNAASIERRAQEALQELRIAVDALQPSEGNIGAVLGGLRYRLGDMIQASGLHFSWEVAELPEIRGLTPSVVFAIQRILLEAIGNVLKHAGARTLRFTARAAGADWIEIGLEDDGSGFDPDRIHQGMGMRNMRNRAERIGARLEIASTPGIGSRVRLLVPQRLEASPSDGRSSPSSAARVTAAGPEWTASFR